MEINYYGIYKCVICQVSFDIRSRHHSEFDLCYRCARHKEIAASDETHKKRQGRLWL